MIVVCDDKKRILELIEQGADEEVIEEAKMELIRSRFEGLENAREVSIEELKRMEAAGECTKNVIFDGEDFLNALSAGEFD